MTRNQSPPPILTLNYETLCIMIKLTGPERIEILFIIRFADKMRKQKHVNELFIATHSDRRYIAKALQGQLNQNTLNRRNVRDLLKSGRDSLLEDDHSILFAQNFEEAKIGYFKSMSCLEVNLIDEINSVSKSNNDNNFLKNFFSNKEQFLERKFVLLCYQPKKSFFEKRPHSYTNSFVSKCRVIYLIFKKAGF